MDGKCAPSKYDNIGPKNHIEKNFQKSVNWKYQYNRGIHTNLQHVSNIIHWENMSLQHKKIFLQEITLELLLLFVSHPWSTSSLIASSRVMSPCLILSCRSLYAFCLASSSSLSLASFLRSAVDSSSSSPESAGLCIVIGFSGWSSFHGPLSPLSLSLNNLEKFKIIFGTRNSGGSMMRRGSGECSPEMQLQVEIQQSEIGLNSINVSSKQFGC